MARRYGPPMFLWISFAFLAAAVATLLLRSSQTETPREPSNPDLAVYRDQLAELDAEVARGAIDPALQATARAEIARRLMKAADAATAPASARPAMVSADRVLAAAALVVPLASLALYLVVGQPSLPGRPLAARLAEPADIASPTDLIAKVEARLRDKPDDGQGWAVLAPIYLAQGRAFDATDAYVRAIKLVGETPDRLAGLAKAHVLAGNGIVNDAARKAYERLATLDPTRIEARFWLAVAEEQNGRPDVAANAYRAMLATAPADAPWKSAVEERLKAVTDLKAGPPTPASVPPSGITPPVLSSAAGPVDGQKSGPSPAEFVAAAQKLPPEMREQMIGRMITKATDAVKQNPKDVSAWSRVVTGQTALGKPSEAKSALKDARGAVAGDTSALSELDALAKTLGLAS